MRKVGHGPNGGGGGMRLPGPEKEREPSAWLVKLGALLAAAVARGDPKP